MFKLCKQHFSRIVNNFNTRNSVNFHIPNKSVIKKLIVQYVLLSLISVFFIGFTYRYGSIVLFVEVLILLIIPFIYVTLLTIEKHRKININQEYNHWQSIFNDLSSIYLSLMLAAILVLSTIYYDFIDKSELIFLLVAFAVFTITVGIKRKMNASNVISLILNIFWSGIVLYLIFNSVNNLFYIMIPKSKLIWTIVFSTIVYIIYRVIHFKTINRKPGKVEQITIIIVSLLVVISSLSISQTIPSPFIGEHMDTSGELLETEFIKSIDINDHLNVDLYLENDDFFIFYGKKHSEFNQNVFFVYDWDFNLVKKIEIYNAGGLIEIPGGYAVYSMKTEYDTIKIEEFNSLFEYTESLEFSVINSDYIAPSFKYNGDYYMGNNRYHSYYKLNGFFPPDEVTPFIEEDGFIYYQNDNVVYFSYDDFIYSAGSMRVDIDVYHGAQTDVYFSNGYAKSIDGSTEVIPLNDYISEPKWVNYYSLHNRYVLTDLVTPGDISNGYYILNDTRNRIYAFFYNDKLVHEITIQKHHRAVSNKDNNYIFLYKDPLNYSQSTTINVFKFSSDISTTTVFRKPLNDTYLRFDDYCDITDHIGDLCVPSTSRLASILSSSAMLIVIIFTSVGPLIRFKTKKGIHYT